MEKRYQVFVSSTYTDLIEARKIAIKTILDFDCIPVGMEMFPASDDDAWTLIKEVIDASDYYLLILAGRYGSRNDVTNIGYTEMEFDYALEQNKPIISFVHSNIENLKGHELEKDEAGRESLQKFRAKAESKTVKYWEAPSELSGLVALGLRRLEKTANAEGWVRGRYAKEQQASNELILRKKIEDLEKELQTFGRVDTDRLFNIAQGEDTFELHYSQKKTTGRSLDLKFGTNESVTTTWNDIFKACGHTLRYGARDENISDDIIKYIHLKSCRGTRSISLTNEASFLLISIETDMLQKIIYQFKALQYIDHEKNYLWKLTKHGDRVLTELLSLKRNSLEANLSVVEPKVTLE